MGAHDNEIGATLLREINNAGTRRGTGETSAQPRTFPKILENIVMKGLFERHPIHVVYLLARTPHVKENQLCFIQGSELMRISNNLSRAWLQICCAKDLPYAPRLVLEIRYCRAHGKDGAMRLP